MPGLRHAHTLQQLRTKDNIFSLKEIILIVSFIKLVMRCSHVRILISSLVICFNTLPGVSTNQISLVVVVCEHGVSPAFKISCSSNIIS